MQNLPEGERMIAYDCLIDQADVGLRRSALLIDQRKALKKVIQFRHAAVERFHGVFAPELFDAALSAVWWDRQRTLVPSSDVERVGGCAAAHRGP